MYVRGSPRWAKPSSQVSAGKRPKEQKTSRQGKDVSDCTPTVHSPWDPSPMAAPAGSTASAGTAPPVAIGATGAAAAAATARTGATTAQINLAPSTDLPRKERDGAPKTQKTTHSTNLTCTHTPTTQGAPCTSDENSRILRAKTTTRTA